MVAIVTIDEEIKKLPQSLQKKLKRLIEKEQLSRYDKHTLLSYDRVAGLITKDSPIFKNVETLERIPIENIYCNPFYEVCRIFDDTNRGLVSIGSKYLKRFIDIVGLNNIDYIVLVYSKKEEGKGLSERLERALYTDGLPCVKIKNSNLFYCIAPKIEW